MLYADRIVKKMNQLRKKGFKLSDYVDTNINNWSSPGLMSVLISLFMIMIFFFESLGILNPEINDIIVSEKLRVFSEKDREQNIEKMRKIMIESALEQIIEEKDFNSYTNIKKEEESTDFFDF